MKFQWPRSIWMGRKCFFLLNRCLVGSNCSIFCHPLIRTTNTGTIRFHLVTAQHRLIHTPWSNCRWRRRQVGDWCSNVYTLYRVHIVIIATAETSTTTTHVCHVYAHLWLMVNSIQTDNKLAIPPHHPHHTARSTRYSTWTKTFAFTHRRRRPLQRLFVLFAQNG